MKKRFRACFLAGVLAASSAATAQTNLLTNGDFESGATGWTEWSNTAWATGFFEHTYSNTTDIHVPSFYPYAGVASHSQKVLAIRAHGGLLQVVDVQAGHTYSVSGAWSCGIGGANVSPPAVAWFEITVYDGAVDGAVVDQAPGPNDVVIDKVEYSGQTGSFDWTNFSNTFTANSNQATLALKTGTYGDEADYIACHHDNLVITELVPASVPVGGGLALFLLGLLMAATAFFATRRRVY